MIDTTIFEKQLELDIPSDLGIYYSGKRINTKNHVYGPEIRNHYLFVLVNNGNACLYGEKNIFLKPHDLLVMFPGQRIHYKASGLWSIQWVGVYGNGADRLTEKLGVTRKFPVMNVHCYREVETALESIYASAGDLTLSGMLNSLSLLYEFFSILFQNANSDQQDDIVQSAIKIIRYNYSQQITVSSIANSLHLNSAYFSRLFASKTGISPKQFILSLRLERAKELLQQQAIPVAEVSRSAGFSDQLYFSRLFRQKIGLSPSQFRNLQKEGPQR